jgi:hypothetical protein
MQILALEHGDGTGGGNACAPYLRSEAHRVWQLYQQGIIRHAFFRPDTHEAVLILETGTLEEAGSILQSLPLVERKLIGFELIPLAPYTGYERLFADHPTPTGSNR